ncbi:hypothetical protein TNIN_84991 [Trichonephila inaurata madagascariensis]|uniref:Uncharacterized protein n=1 Tax=Trichonephila inaurata madagascariensis TaxID=2747483 RepID=A0A8X7BUE8_9ARAC|nr:hypothetical protein TNIN_84991 [Trichonephila inaurata madagascariensis]
MRVLSNEFEWNVSCSVNLITSQSGVSDEEMPWRDSSTEMNELKTFLVSILFVVIAFGSKCLAKLVSGCRCEREFQPANEKFARGCFGNDCFASDILRVCS